MHASKITTKGQVTIPQKLRQLLGIRPGDKVAFETGDNGKVFIRKVDSRVSLAGSLKNKINQPASDQAIDDAISHGWTNRGSD